MVEPRTPSHAICVLWLRNRTHTIIHNNIIEANGPPFLRLLKPTFSDLRSNGRSCRIVEYTCTGGPSHSPVSGVSLPQVSYVRILIIIY